MVVVVVFNYLILMRMIQVRNYTNFQQDVHYVVSFLSFVLLLMMPRLLTDTVLCLEIFGFTWVTQILWNQRTHRHWQFHYSLVYVIVQSINFCFLPVYARGIERNFYFLKPNSQPVRALFCLQIA